ncbi:MAG TPA: hypothetical protein VM901_08005 [Bdellovibrionota bacterium]|jgi:hypothetical protein|nr:hypothetical protein [Bdellovibrionota bacterium]
MRASKRKTFVKILSLSLSASPLFQSPEARAQSKNFEIRRLERSAPLEESQDIDIIVRPTAQPKRLQYPVYLGLVYRHPVFGDIPLSSGQLRGCDSENCSFRVIENGQTRRYLPVSPRTADFFLIEINDPDLIRKILEDGRNSQGEARGKGSFGLRLTPFFGRRSLYLKESPKDFFDTGDPTDHFAFNDSKYSRHVTWGSEFGLEIKSKFLVADFKSYSNDLSTRGYFSSDTDPPVETHVSELQLALGVHQKIWNLDLSLMAVHQRRDFKTNLTDDYSILSTAYHSWGLRAGVGLDFIDHSLIFAPIIGLRVTPPQLRAEYHPVGNATDSGEFQRGDSATFGAMSGTLALGLETISNRWWLNKFNFTFAYTYERSWTKFSGEVSYPSGYPDPSVFNSNSRSTARQSGFSIQLSRSLDL